MDTDELLKILARAAFRALNDSTEKKEYTGSAIRLLGYMRAEIEASLGVVEAEEFFLDSIEGEE